MADSSKLPGTIDQYIDAHPPQVRAILQRIRRAVRGAAPLAEEIISYRMPAFRQQGILVYFAASKNHIGLFPPVSGDPKLMKAAGPYAGPKGNLRFPLNEPIPYDLIKRIVQHRLKQNLAKTAKPRKHPAAGAAKRPVRGRK